MPNLAVTTLTAAIMPDVNGLMRGLTGTSLTNQLSQAGLYSGKSWAGGFARAVSGLRLGGVIAGSIAGAMGMEVIKGGLTRALDIETAQAKLKGLGYQMQDVQDITKNTLDAVTGTAYSLNEGMTVASTALAAGINKGQDLTNYLKLVTDTATITGGTLGEIGAVFNKAVSNVKLNQRELNQLSNRGLPIYEWLAKDKNVTVQEVRKMITAGKLNSNDLLKAVNENIGGSASQSANTTRGAFKNLQAAYSRLGVVIEGGALPIVKHFFLAQRDMADSLSKTLAPAMDKFWTNLAPKANTAIDNFTATFKKLLSGGYNNTPQMIALKEFFHMLAELDKLVMPVLGAFIRLISVLFDKLFDAFNRQLPAITKGFDWVSAGLDKMTASLQKTNGKDLNGIGSGIMNGLKATLPFLDFFGKAFQKIFSGLGNGVGAKAAALFWEDLKKLFADLWDGIKKIAPELWDLIKQITTVQADNLSVMIPALLAIIPSLVKLLDSLIPIVINLISAILPDLGRLLPPILDALGKIMILLATALPPVIDWLTQLFSGQFGNSLTDILITVLKLITDILDKTLKAIDATAKLTGGFFQNTQWKADGSTNTDWNKVLQTLAPANYASAPATDMGKVTGYANVVSGANSWAPPKKLWTGGNIAGSANGSMEILGDRNKAETVTDLGQTNDFIASTLKLVKNQNSQAAKAPVQVTQHNHHTIVNNSSMSGEQIKKELDDFYRTHQIYTGQ